MGETITRRDAIRGIGLGGIAVAAAAVGCRAESGGPAGMAGMAGPEPFALPPLPYKSLEPVLDDQTLAIHHDKHHLGYVNGANAALAALASARDAGDYATIKFWERELAFAASGAALHALYWASMWPGGRSKPSGDLAKAIDEGFGSYEKMVAQFKAATKAVEASGWGVLAWEPTSKRLVILQAEKHQNLTIWASTPILACDVWEHAYYLKYQNRRPEYVDAWMGIVDWQSASERFEAIAK